MIQIKITNDFLELIDSETNNSLYEIGINDLYDKSRYLSSSPEWILQLSSKTFIKSNKECLYRMAVFIEKTKPDLFNWNETFNYIEYLHYNSAVFKYQSQSLEKNFGASDVADLVKLEVDNLTSNDDSIKKQIKLVVDDNLRTYNLPAK